ncbi:MAG: phosphoglycerate kinase [Malacoplasma sp.]|nr:phosphoglycerate kinase [Malacoplasma sp.]
MEYNKKLVTDLHNLKGKRVVLRCDFNVPISKTTGLITDPTRILAALDTIGYLLDKGAKVIVMSHLSRIKKLDDKTSGKKSLKIVYEKLKQLLPGKTILFAKNNLDKSLISQIDKMEDGSLLLLENTRYADVNESGEVVKWESKNNTNLAKFWASFADAYVNDAFGTCHRAHASNVGIASNVKESAIGFLVDKELSKLSKAIKNPARPVVAIFGGAKVSDKVDSIRNIAKVSDKVLIGGGMAYIFLKAKGFEIGNSLCENDQIDVAKSLLNEFGEKIVLPVDVKCANNIEAVRGINVLANTIPSHLAGFDIGRQTIRIFKRIIKTARTVIWNGPLGVFENYAFSKGTRKVCKAVAKVTRVWNCYSVIGGGDSAAAVIGFGYGQAFSHISTGGGASLDFFADKILPGIDCIQNKNGEIHKTVVATPVEKKEIPAAPVKKEVKAPAKKVVKKAAPKKKKPVAKKTVQPKKAVAPVVAKPVQKQEPKVVPQTPAPVKKAAPAKKPATRKPVDPKQKITSLYNRFKKEVDNYVLDESTDKSFSEFKSLFDDYIDHPQKKAVEKKKTNKKK